MSGTKLPLPATAALIVLMHEAREVSNPELKERYGITLTGEERKLLNRMKLVNSRRAGRAYAHELTDAGWKYLSDEFRAGTLTMPTGSGGAIARALVAGLAAFMKRTNYPLAEIFAPAPAETPTSDIERVDHHPASPSSGQEVPMPDAKEADHRPAPPAGQAAAEPDARQADPDIEVRVRKAYAELADKPGAWVSLTRLRPLLADVPRDVLDDVLRRMNRLPDVTLIPETNQKGLTDLDREAAVTVGDQDKHLLWIGV